MKYPKEQWLEKPEDIKIQTIQDELELETHNGTTKEDLLMMLRWLFDQFDVVEAGKTETIEECPYVRNNGMPNIYHGKCDGFAKSDTDDEPCEACKECKHNIYNLD